MLQDLNIDNVKLLPADCICVSSQFIYNPRGYFITGYPNIMNTNSLKNVYLKAEHNVSLN